MRIFLLCLFVWCGSWAFGSEFRIIGRASLFTNDYLGDGADRWRSGSYSRSSFIAQGWEGEIPSTGLYEFRIRGELIAPSETNVPPKAGERPFVGVLALGLMRHVVADQANLRFGGELVAIGPQTGVSSFVTQAHELLGFKEPRATAGQLADDLIPTGLFEASRLIGASGIGPYQLRPFVEAQVGVETYGRLGVDAIFGDGIDGDLLTRDVVTGQIMTVIPKQGRAGFTPMIGADFARVFESRYLPRSTGLTLEAWRMRVRGGLRHIGASRDIFMGVTWLSPEYEGQPGGQILGSISIDHYF